MTIRAREDVIPAMLKQGCNTDMAGGIERYLFDRIEPGGFLSALLADSLTRAYGKADINNRACMFQWAMFLYNEMPVGTWGSDKAVNDWLNPPKDEES